METFYTRLTQIHYLAQDPYMERLANLTRIELSQLQRLRAMLVWNLWS